VFYYQQEGKYKSKIGELNGKFREVSQPKGKLSKIYINPKVIQVKGNSNKRYGNQRVVQVKAIHIKDKSSKREIN